MKRILLFEIYFRHLSWLFSTKHVALRLSFVSKPFCCQTVVAFKMFVALTLW